MNDEAPYPDNSHCPRRAWVLDQLADDESIKGQCRPSSAVQLHLARCETCRMASEELLATNELLADVIAATPSDALLRDADRRATQAIQAGAKPSRRIDLSRIPEESRRDSGPADSILVRYPEIRWLYERRQIIAASVVLMALVGFSALLHVWKGEPNIAEIELKRVDRHPVTWPADNPPSKKVAPATPQITGGRFVANSRPAKSVRRDPVRDASLEHVGSSQRAFPIPEIEESKTSLLKTMSNGLREFLIDTRLTVDSTSPNSPEERSRNEE